MNIENNKIIKNILIFLTYFIFTSVNPILGIILIPIFYLLIFDFTNIVKNVLFYISLLILFIGSIILISNGSFSGNINNILLLLVVEIMTIASLIYIHFNKIKLDRLNFDFKLFLNNIKYWFLGLILMGISTVIIDMLISNNTSLNQELIEELLLSSPILLTILIVVFAPIIEELIYRLVLRNIFKNPIIYIFMSGLLFGFAHVADYSNLSEFLFIIPYGILGASFAYTYHKTDNILVPISLHFLHNSLAIILLILEGVL